MGRRYAVYHSPDRRTKLSELGRLVLGRGLSDPPASAGAPKASVYGFHATLVAPFSTKALVSDLLGALAEVAEAFSPIELGPLELAILPPGFPALAPASPPKELGALEEALVRKMSAHRLPPSPGEAARRGALAPRQKELWQKWGYPFVMEEFRYHLTLGDHVEGASEGKKKLSELAGIFGGEILGQGLVLDKLALCVQEGPGLIFRAMAEVALGTASFPQAALSSEALSDNALPTGDLPPDSRHLEPRPSSKGSSKNSSRRSSQASSKLSSNHGKNPALSEGPEPSERSAPRGGPLA